MNDILQQFKAVFDRDYGQAYERAIHIGLENPEYVKELLLYLMHNYPNSSTLFRDLFSYLPDDEYPDVIESALTILREDRHHEAAQTAIAWASLQALPALHPHLDALYHLAPNERSYFSDYPWRESGLQHVDFLSRIAADRTMTKDERVKACKRLLETRQPEAMSFVLAWADDLGLDAELHLYGVGYEWNDTGFRRLYFPESSHLIFPLDYRTYIEHPYWVQKTHHPTWRLPDSNGLFYRFGGLHHAECAVCGNRLHHLLTLDPVPSSLHLPSLTLATCLSCLGWSQPILFYKHQANGQPESTGYAGPPNLPKFPAEPLREVSIYLARSPSRWQWQAWGMSNGRQNLHRLGGHPVWIQNADYPVCVQCQRRMHFIIQLDSDLLTHTGTEWLWGSGGICYGFWCDQCRISAFSWQCT
jgi:hypothetical protein